jgi:hypothetical protein
MRFLQIPVKNLRKMKKLILKVSLLLFTVAAIAQTQNNNQPYNTNPTNAPTMQHQTPGTNQQPDSTSKNKYHNDKKSMNKSNTNKSQNSNHSNTQDKKTTQPKGTNSNTNMPDTVR